MKTEPEIGVMLAQDMEFLGLPDAGRDKEESCPRGSGGIMALETP